ncbi:MAG: radical SAM protein [Desulfobacteraceae bacterium]|nr:radical SAM protein [Desulfobacteraceae bacterium]
MKVLMISTNREKSPFAVAPIGAAKVFSALQKSGHEVCLLDLCFSRSIQRSIKKAVYGFSPDIIALSIRNLDNCAYVRPHAYFPADRRIVEMIRRCCRAPIVIGGSGVSVAPGELTAYLGVDYAIAGEGERSMPAFLSALANQSDFESVPGLWYRQDGRWRANQPDFGASLSDLPIQAYNRIDFGRYFSTGGFVAIQTKRGCPFECIYCSYSALEGRRQRFLPAGLCVDEIEKIVRDTHKSDFFFVDGVFNFPPAHAAAVCKEIIRRNLKIRWLAYCNPSGLDYETAELFKAAGCAGIELGLDAATEKMLANLNKGFTVGEIQRTYRALHRAGLPFAVFLLFGGPGETYEDWEQTQRNLQGFGKANAVFASLGIRIYDHTSMFDLAVNQGCISPDASLLAPCFYLSPHLLNDSPVRRLDRLARRDSTWSTPTDWNSITVRVIQWFLARSRVIPCWRDIENYGAYMRRRRS